MHTYYAIHYARLSYDDNHEIDQTGEPTEPFAKGLEFPHEGLVSYRDFLYYSSTIAMCYQTSDVSIRSSLTLLKKEATEPFRSSLTLLKKEGSEPFKAPLFKGDLGGSLQNKLTNQKILKYALALRKPKMA